LKQEKRSEVIVISLIPSAVMFVLIMSPAGFVDDHDWVHCGCGRAHAKG
jgi:hypothetical protein